MSSPNNTYILNIENTVTFPYYAINVELHKQDDTFSLHYGTGKLPDFSLNLSEITEVQGFDIYGYLENRFTHFILLSNEDFYQKQIYLYTSSEWTQIYNITVTATSDKLCPNNCTNQGSRQDGKCLCNKYYIGNDCHQQATHIVQNKEMFFNLQNTVKYAYVDLEESGNQTMSLIVQTKSSEGVDVYIMKTRVLYIHALQDLNRNIMINQLKAMKFHHCIQLNLKQKTEMKLALKFKIESDIYSNRSLLENNTFKFHWILLIKEPKIQSQLLQQQSQLHQLLGLQCSQVYHLVLANTSEIRKLKKPWLLWP